MMEEVLKTDTKENWAQKLRHLPAGPIRTMKEALDEPEVKRRGMLKTYKRGTAARCRSSARTTASPTRPSTTPARRRALGEHTDEVLQASRIGEQEIAALGRRRSSVGEGPSLRSG